MAKKDPLIPTTLDELMQDFVERIPIERDEHGRFINKGKTSLRFGATPASSPVTGDMWLKPGGEGTTYVYDGSTWVQVGGSASGA